MSVSIRSTLIWGLLATVLLAPVVIAANSPLLAWRQPVYIIAGFAGVISLCLLLLQPLLAGDLLPGVKVRRARQVHRWLGSLLVTTVVIHIAGLWITSPPDVVDALLLRSPTPFSLWGVIALWAVVLAASLAALRRRLRVHVWRICHTALVVVTVASTVAHAVLIQGTMGSVSKTLLCALVAMAMCAALWQRKIWRILR